jgi:hypothetical protein
MIIGFTGTRVGMTEKQKEKVKYFLDFYKATELHHGDCIGADSDAHSIARNLNVPITIHPPLNLKKRMFNNGYAKLLEKFDYTTRNENIVEASDVLLACPKSSQEELRSGTWATVRYAKKQQKEIVVIYPDGTWLVY